MIHFVRHSRPGFRTSKSELLATFSTPNLESPACSGGMVPLRAPFSALPLSRADKGAKTQDQEREAGLEQDEHGDLEDRELGMPEARHPPSRFRKQRGR